MIRSLNGVVRKHCVLGAECGARQGQHEFEGRCGPKLESLRKMVPSSVGRVWVNGGTLWEVFLLRDRVMVQ